MRSSFFSLTHLLFTSSVFFFWFFIRELGLVRGLRHLGTSVERKELQKVVAVLHEFQERIEAGLVPTPEHWEKIAQLPKPWGALASESLLELRARGGAVLPTLRRMRALVERHQEALAQARARSAQALVQAMACGGLVPIFGTLLYWLLPGVDQRPWLWIFFCGLALVLGGCGAVWLLKMAETARWGGLAGSERPWVIAAQCAGERLLALVRSGQPPDLAWAEATRFLAVSSPALARVWGFQIFETPSKPAVQELGKEEGASCRGALIEAGAGIRRAIQVSLMEGRPCAERIESALEGMRVQLAAGIERELQLLGTRALKPLFILVAPALFGLLGAGLVLTWKSSL